ncbi:HpcH/HpaI aldolase family protein [Spirosoma telluris]|uniref:HpcH/HpaI aldolase family protein n=1 Tax=Spirosoma telluris TaxID=2183553 RepID=UPI002FC2C50B
MNQPSLRQKLQQGKNVYGSCITSTAPMWPKVIQQTGLDFVFLDTEHIPLDRAELARLCQQFRAYGITPIVRIPSPDPFRACQVIDGGAIGVVAPYLESVEQIQELVGATKFRPLKGERLAVYLTGQEEMSAEMKAYIDNFNANTICIANIESVPALNRLDDLLSVPGLDAVFIGPMTYPLVWAYPSNTITLILKPQFEALFTKRGRKDSPLAFIFRWSRNVRFSG